MGREARCKAEYHDQVSQGKALLETDALIFRGDFRLSIPLATIASAKAHDGLLTVRFPDGTAVFHLGPQAQKWAAAICNPKGLLDKLGIKAGAKVGVLGIPEPAFLSQLAERGAHLLSDDSTGKADALVLAAESTQHLERLPDLRATMQPRGMLWVVFPKGQRHITESKVLQAGRAAGLTDVKVVRFSDTHAALKFVILVAKR